MEAGARWADVDAATQAHGLFTPGGEVSVTGWRAHARGGIGATMRGYGLACDNLRSLEVVTADGRLLTASHDEHAALLGAAEAGAGSAS